MEVDIDKIMHILDTAYDTNKLISSMEEAKDPYKLLISCLLSLRTKDDITYDVSKNLFKIADTPEKILALDLKELEKIIFKTGFYHNKALTLQHVSKEILERFNSKVPNTMEELLSMKGVGRKTANLVLAKGFDIPAICVDTHVHRISNRIGYVNTKDPFETEMELRKKLPINWWKTINSAFVRHGQETCKPIGPKCAECKINKYCNKLIAKKKK